MPKSLKIFGLILVISLASLQPACKRMMSDAERDAVKETISTSADAFGQAISRLDAEGVAGFFSQADSAEYVGDGVSIPREKIKETFQNAFGRLQEMNFGFEKKEVRVLNPNAAVLTGWVHSVSIAKDGRKTDERAILTNVYMRADKKWSIIQSHKSPVPTFPHSETSKARPRLSKFCQGNGIDLGYGGDPIVPTAITMDLPRPYTKLGDHPQNLAGDARDLYWFKNNVLDYVYSSHLLEDFDPQEVVGVIREWLRIIKPGGVLIIYCPDQPAYVAYSKKNGLETNPGHKTDNFGLKYVKGLLERNFQGKYSIIHEIELIDDYCFDLVIKKL